MSVIGVKMSPSVYVPRELFTGAHVDVLEWDGKQHTVKVTLDRKRDLRDGLFQRDIGIEYCDGVRHLLPLETFKKMLVGAHRFSWTHFYSGGGSSTYELPYYYVRGCECSR